MKVSKYILSLTRLCVFFSIFLISCGKQKEQKNVQSPEKSIMTVNGFIVKPEQLSNVIRTTGTILAFDEVELKAEASGRIIKIYFTEGSHVNKEDLLIKINDEDLQAQLRKNELQIKLTGDELSRQEQLLKINATSQQEYDIASNQLNSLKADKDFILSEIKKTEIRAPFNGVVGLRYVSEGSYVTPLSRIASIQNINPLKIDFSIPEKYSGVVNKGDIITFNSEGSTDNFTGKVFAIEPKIDLNTRTLQVRALCENKNEKIFPGSFAKIELQLKDTPDALMIPTQALIPVLKGQIVYVSKGGQAQSVPVKTGVRTDVKVQVTDGLAAGDTIITTGIMSLKPNTPVKVVVKP